jgi:hypothetical protein
LATFLPTRPRESARKQLLRSGASLERGRARFGRAAPLSRAKDPRATVQPVGGAPRRDPWARGLLERVFWEGAALLPLCRGASTARLRPRFVRAGPLARAQDPCGPAPQVGGAPRRDRWARGLAGWWCLALTEFPAQASVLSTGVYLREFLMLAAGGELDTQSELVQTSILLSPAFHGAVVQPLRA